MTARPPTEDALEAAIREWVAQTTEGGITTSYVVVACALLPHDDDSTTYVHLYPRQQPVHIAQGLTLRALNYLQRTTEGDK